MLLAARLTWCTTGTAEGTELKEWGGEVRLRLWISKQARWRAGVEKENPKEQRQGILKVEEKDSPSWLVLTLMAAAWGGSGLSSVTPLTACTSKM